MSESIDSDILSFLSEATTSIGVSRADERSEVSSDISNVVSSRSPSPSSSSSSSDWEGVVRIAKRKGMRLEVANKSRKPPAGHRPPASCAPDVKFPATRHILRPSRAQYSKPRVDTDPVSQEVDKFFRRSGDEDSMDWASKEEPSLLRRRRRPEADKNRASDYKKGARLLRLLDEEPPLLHVKRLPEKHLPLLRLRSRPLLRPKGCRVDPSLPQPTYSGTHQFGVGEENGAVETGLVLSPEALQRRRGQAGSLHRYGPAQPVLRTQVSKQDVRKIIKIQALFRGRQARDRVKSLQHSKAAAAAASRLAAVVFAKDRNVKARTHRAATLIQAVWRRFLARRAMRRLRVRKASEAAAAKKARQAENNQRMRRAYAAITIQRVFRGWCARKLVSDYRRRPNSFQYPPVKFSAARRPPPLTAVAKKPSDTKKVPLDDDSSAYDAQMRAHDERMKALARLQESEKKKIQEIQQRMAERAEKRRLDDLLAEYKKNMAAARIQKAFYGSIGKDHKPAIERQRHPERQPEVAPLYFLPTNESDSECSGDNENGKSGKGPRFLRVVDLPAEACALLEDDMANKSRLDSSKRRRPFDNDVSLPDCLASCDEMSAQAAYLGMQNMVRSSKEHEAGVLDGLVSAMEQRLSKLEKEAHNLETDFEDADLAVRALERNQFDSVLSGAVRRADAIVANVLHSIELNNARDDVSVSTVPEGSVSVGMDDTMMSSAFAESTIRTSTDSDMELPTRILSTPGSSRPPRPSARSRYQEDVEDKFHPTVAASAEKAKGDNGSALDSAWEVMGDLNAASEVFSSLIRTKPKT
eukprot:Rmarinus@m.25251